MEQPPSLQDMSVPGIAQSKIFIEIAINKKETQQTFRRPIALVAREIANDVPELKSFKNLQIISVESSEKTKSIAFRDALFSEHQASLESMDAFIVVGGGTILNLGTALAALLTERALGHLPFKDTLERPAFHFTIIPTTVLSMADAAYGSAGMLNDGPVKNALSLKFDPDRIVLNRDYLTTLPTAEKKRGLIECLKHAIMQEIPNSDNAPTVEECLTLLKSESPDNDDVFSCVLKTIKARAQIAEAVNAGNAMASYLPSYGHLDVEPREVASHYKLAHGDAVLFGLMLETSLSGLTNVTKALQEIVPFTPLAAQLCSINYTRDAMKEAYRQAVRQRFRTETQDCYKAVHLTKTGQFSILDANTAIPFETYSLDTLYAHSQKLFSSIQGVGPSL